MVGLHGVVRHSGRNADVFESLSVQHPHLVGVPEADELDEEESELLLSELSEDELSEDELSEDESVDELSLEDSDSDDDELLDSDSEDEDELSGGGVPELSDEEELELDELDESGMALGRSGFVYLKLGVVMLMSG